MFCKTKKTATKISAGATMTALSKSSYLKKYGQTSRKTHHFIKENSLMKWCVFLEVSVSFFTCHYPKFI